MQVDPIKPTLKPPGTKLLKLKHEKLVSSFGNNFHLRRYIVVIRALVQQNPREHTHIVMRLIRRLEMLLAPAARSAVVGRCRLKRLTSMLKAPGTKRLKL